MSFLPELTLLGVSLVFFLLSLREANGKQLHAIAAGMAALVLLSALISLKSEGELFFKAYQVDYFSQLFKERYGMPPSRFRAGRRG